MKATLAYASSKEPCYTDGKAQQQEGQQTC